MSDADIKVCVDALWDNAIDGRRADRLYNSDFDRAERELRESFEAWLKE